MLVFNRFFSSSLVTGVLIRMLPRNEELVKKETEAQRDLPNSCLAVCHCVLLHWAEFGLFI